MIGKRYFKFLRAVLTYSDSWPVSINHFKVIALNSFDRPKTFTFFYVCVENTNVPEHLWHGDMIGNPGRAGHKLRKWPNGIVHYIYDHSIGELDYVHWPGPQLAKKKYIYA